MKSTSIASAVLLAMNFSLAHAAGDAAPHWGYEGEAGPAAWGKEFPTCGLGKAQSPIDIKGPFGKATQAIKPDYKEANVPKLTFTLVIQKDKAL